MSKISLIIEREYLTRVKKKSFILITLLGPLVIGLGLAAVIWLSITEDVNHKVLILTKKHQHSTIFKILKT